MPFHYEMPLPKLRDEPSPQGPVRLVRWLLEEGAPVVKGTPVVIVASEGTSYEVRANGEGSLRKRLAFEGQVLQEGRVLSRLQQTRKISIGNSTLTSPLPDKERIGWWWTHPMRTLARQ